MPTPATGQTPYIQRYQSGPVIAQAHLSVGEQQAERKMIQTS